VTWKAKITFKFFHSCLTSAGAHLVQLKPSKLWQRVSPRLMRSFCDHSAATIFHCGSLRFEHFFFINLIYYPEISWGHVVSKLYNLKLKLDNSRFNMTAFENDA